MSRIYKTMIMEKSYEITSLNEYEAAKESAKMYLNSGNCLIEGEPSHLFVFVNGKTVTIECKNGVN